MSRESRQLKKEKRMRENEEEKVPGLKESSQKEEVEEGWTDGSMGGSC